MMTPKQLQGRLPSAAFAFRGYNHTNLGRSYELLTHKVYGRVVEQELREASEKLSPIVRRDLNLVDRVRRQEDTTLETYADAIVLIVAMEMAQIRLLRDFFGVVYETASMAFGYSLGEVAALIASGVMSLEHALPVPLALADDCVALAHEATLGVLFTRRGELPMDKIFRACVRTNLEGHGVIGVSSILAPNSVLLIGQYDTLDRCKARLDEQHAERLFLRKNEHRWPPLHTPIVWQRYIPDRTAQLMQTMPGALCGPMPRVLSLVTGDFSYNDYNTRELLHRWTDEPQRLWDAVTVTLSQSIDTIVHVGPSPNIVPATYTRLAENVTVQMKKSMSMRAMSNLVGRPWLKNILPAQTALLRAPMVQQIILEDWLLAQEVK